MDKKMLKHYSWVLRGSQRMKVMDFLNSLGKPIIPTKIKIKTELSPSNVSDVLKTLVKKGLAICLNPKAKTGRLYQLTGKGKKVIIEIKKIDA